MTTPFTDGIACGDPTATSIVLWTRAPALDEVTWSVASSDGVRHGVAAVDHRRDHTIHVLVDDLSPATEHSYRFTARGHATAVGRFTTIDPNATEARFAVATCAKYNSGYFHAYRAIAQRDDLAFVLHLGDYIYEAANVPPRSQTPGADIGRDFDPLHECFTLEDYRRRYRQYRNDPDVRRLHERHAIVNTLDDHELADNATRHGAQEHDEDRDGPWGERMTAALRAWEEWQPTMRRPTEGGAIFTALDLGTCGRLVITEDRTNRDPLAASPTQLGDAQRAWLHSQIDDTGPERWFVLAVPSSLASFWNGATHPLANEAMRTIKVIQPDGSGPFPDLWDSFPSERAGILSALAARGGRRLVLAGDVHIAMEAALAAPDGAFAATECTTPSITSANLDDKRGWVGTDRSAPYAEAMVDALDELAWCELDTHGFVAVGLTTTMATVDWWGTTEVTEPIAELRLLRRTTIGPDGQATVT